MDLKVKKVLLSSDFEIVNRIKKNDGNSDVIVYLENGKKYIASFFSYNYIEEVNLEHMKNGEYLSGKYFWKKNMVLVDECSLKVIEQVIDDLIDEGDFQVAFLEI